MKQWNPSGGLFQNFWYGATRSCCQDLSGFFFMVPRFKRTCFKYLCPSVHLSCPHIYKLPIVLKSKMLCLIMNRGEVSFPMRSLAETATQTLATVFLWPQNPSLVFLFSPYLCLPSLHSLFSHWPCLLLGLRVNFISRPLLWKPLCRNPTLVFLSKSGSCVARCPRIMERWPSQEAAQRSQALKTNCWSELDFFLFSRSLTMPFVAYYSDEAVGRSGARGIRRKCNLTSKWNKGG